MAAAGKLSQYLTTGTHQLQSNMAPAQKPVKIDPRLESGAETARKVSVGVLKVSEYVGECAGGGQRGSAVGRMRNAYSGLNALLNN